MTPARLLEDGVLNVSAQAIGGLASLVTIPLFLGGAGSETYGLWLTGMTATGLVLSVDLGAGAAVTRLVARGGLEFGSVRAMCGGAALMLGALGVAVSIVLVLSAGVLARALSVAPAVARQAPQILGAVALTMLADQQLSLCRSALRGAKRFRLVSTLALGLAVARVSGFGALVAVAAPPVWYGAWHAMASVGAAVVGWILAIRQMPVAAGSTLSPMSAWRHFPLAFGLRSQLLSLAIHLCWEPAGVIASLAGSATAAVTWHVGSRLPLALTMISWPMAESLFPSAARDPPRAAQIAVWCARWTLMLVLPTSFVIGFVAPELLSVWLGSVPDGAVDVLRLMSFAVVVDALGVSALQVAWGLGAVQGIMIIMSAAAAGNLFLGALVVPRVGVVGAATVTAGCIIVSSAAVVCLFARLVHISPLALFHGAVRGLAAPVLLSAALAISAWWWACSWGMAGIALTSLAAALPFAATGAIEWRRGGREL